MHRGGPGGPLVMRCTMQEVIVLFREALFVLPLGRKGSERLCFWGLMEGKGSVTTLDRHSPDTMLV